MWKRLAIGTLLLSQTTYSSDFIPPTSICPLKLFSGSGNLGLSNEIAGYLGIQLGRVQLGKFSDGETSVNVLEDVSGKDVFVICSLGPPVNDNIMELLLLSSSLKRAGCRKLNLIIPYMAYNRHDKPAPGNYYTPSEDISRLIQAFDVDSLIGIDFHADHVDGEYMIPVHKINPFGLAIKYFKSKALMHPIIISPDVRGSTRAYEFYKALRNEGISCDLAILPNPGSSLAHLTGESAILGEILTGRDVIIVDDMVITGSSILKCVEEVRKKDAEKVYCYATHAVLAEGTVQKFNRSSLDECICTNTLEIKEKSSKIIQLSVSRLIANRILEMYHSEH